MEVLEAHLEDFRLDVEAHDPGVALLEPACHVNHRRDLLERTAERYFEIMSTSLFT